MTILRFLAYAHANHLSPASIRVYLSGLHSLHQLNGYPAPDMGSYRIKMALRAIKDRGQKPSQCLPLTFQLIQFIVPNLLGELNGELYAAMICFGFFEALRGAEYAGTYTNDEHLQAPTLDQVQFVRHNQELALIFTILQSKTKCQPVSVPMGCSGTPICAVCLLVRHLQIRAAVTSLHPKSYLFAFPDGRPVTKAQYNAVIKAQVRKLGLSDTGYSTHSLRAGAATTASAAGLSGEHIQALGHWSSNAYQTYVQHDFSTKFAYSRKLAGL